MAFLGKANNLLIRRPSIFVYKFLKQLSYDYRDALIETGKKMVQHPIKTVFYSSNIYLLIYAYQTMPTFQTYKNDLIQFHQQQLLTSSLIRNKKIETYIDTIEKLLLSEQIHFVDCYLFSLIIYRTQYRTNDHSYRIYENICSYLHLKRHSRIIDIGAFNRWFTLKRKLYEADIIDDTNNEKIAL
ncbi:unnamed protein product [Rotaria sp. Silwood1]|nr:unnamed protein product [Rotaria sp. Silwood1]CAF1403886.1 unnamed protein product [Rotaria sp. Silwood1]CAF3512525.1 unnamed protein product [Rotaria sp. Silwood1]CAF3633985.1 unnamed protein product [Rotaria sp. Silwood1]CAF4622596.1 unnamed protein product [Rotaria sp. Silwood1]